MKIMLWYGVLAAMTAAYLIAMWGEALGPAAGCTTPFTPDDDCLHHGGSLAYRICRKAGAVRP